MPKPTIPREASAPSITTDFHASRSATIALRRRSGVTFDESTPDEWQAEQRSAKIAAPWADFEHSGIAKLKAESGHEVYDITPAQLAEWKKAAAPLEAKWAEGAKLAGIDPAAAMKDLKEELAK